MDTTLRFFYVELLLGTEEVYLHLKGAKALTARMVLDTILERYPNATLISMEESEAPITCWKGFLNFSQEELAEEQPHDWLYANEIAIDEDGEEYLSGRQFRLPNKVYFALKAREKRILKGDYRERLSKEIKDFIRDSGWSLEELKVLQKYHSREEVKASLEGIVAHLKYCATKNIQ